LAKEQGCERPVDNLEYPKDLVLDLEYENNLTDITFSAPPLTDYGSKGYSKGEAGAVTP